MRHLLTTMSILFLPLLGAAQFQHIQLNSGLTVPLESQSGNPMIGNSYGVKSHINLFDNNGGLILYGNVNTVPNKNYYNFYERYFIAGLGGYWALTDTGKFRLNFHTIVTNMWYQVNYGRNNNTSTDGGYVPERNNDISPFVVGFDAFYQVSDRIAIGANLDYMGGSYYVAEGIRQSIFRDVRLINAAMSLRYCFN